MNEKHYQATLALKIKLAEERLVYLRSLLPVVVVTPWVPAETDNFNLDDLLQARPGWVPAETTEAVVEPAKRGPGRPRKAAE